MDNLSMKITKPKEFIFYGDNVIRIYNSIYNNWLLIRDPKYFTLIIYFYYNSSPIIVNNLTINITDYDDCIKKIREIYKPSIQIPGIIE